MSTDTLSQASQLSNRELLAQIKVLAEREKGATAALVAHLAVMEDRRLFLREGFDSMFSYCVHALHLTENAALSRIGAARAVMKFPVILDMLTDGSLNLTTLGLLIPELTPENHLGLIEQARSKKVSEVREVVACLRPQPPVPASVRKLPEPRLDSSSIVVAPTAGSSQRSDGVHQANTLNLDGGTQEEAPAPTSMPARANGPSRPSSFPAVIPLGSELYKVQFTADAATREKLQLLQDLLRHKIHDGDIGRIMEMAISALLNTIMKRKLSFTDTPRESIHPHADRGVARSRHIPADVKRAVWTRDGGQCAFVAANGQRCPEHGFLEFHHVVPYAVGGKATVENIQVRCRAHNGFEAELDFGERSPQWRPPPSGH